MPPLIRKMLWAAVAGLSLATIVEGANILVGSNFRTVAAGRVYRCAQPDADDLSGYVSRYGIKTVINLRGCWPAAEWYAVESRATAKLDIAQEDLTFSSGRLPAPAELRRLIDVLDHAEYPILIHCRRGVDRTGLTSAIVKLLYEGATLGEARGQLSLRYGHVALGRTEAMLRFFDLYDHWLTRENRQHDTEAFREFVARGYAPGPAAARLEIVNHPSLHVNAPGALIVRAYNDGCEAWHLRAGSGTGVHLRFRITDGAGRIVQEGKAGLFHKLVPCGQFIDLTLAIDALPTAGAYSLTADLYETPDVAFAQLGSEPLETELHVQ